MKTWQLALITAAFTTFTAPTATAQKAAAKPSEPTPGFSEKVLQWTVQHGETCNDIARALYGDTKHRKLLQRYNSINCYGPIAPGTTLTVPDSTEPIPPARLVSTTPTVRAKAPGAAWSAAAPGMSLYKRYSVNTLDNASADIRFRDRTQVFLGEQTLVIIYDTAEGSQVSSAVDVELDKGELRAGLAALRGKNFRLATSDGGKVLTDSPDTVLRRKNGRTTVSVMSGAAEVKSRGQTVKVPAKFGTAFTKKAAPKPPRELPPAPEWRKGAPQLGIAAADSAVFSVGWNAVPRAEAYRVELASEPSFEAPLIRQETPSSVRNFEARNLPAGDYFVRIQAIDYEDFLGLATERHHVTLMGLERDGSAALPDQNADVLDVHPYEQLRFPKQPQLEMALNDEEFQDFGAVLDLSKLDVKQLRVRRTSDGAERTFFLSYSPVKLEFEGTLRQNTQSVQIGFHGFDGLDVAAKVNPVLVLDDGEQRESRQLSINSSKDGVQTAVVEFERDPTLPMKVEVVDGEGHVLLAEDLPQVEPNHELPPRQPLLGAPSAMLPADASVSTPWWSPARIPSVTVGINTTAAKTPLDGQAVIAAQGFYGPLAVRARVGFDAFNFSQLADSAVWLHAGYAPVAKGSSRLGMLLGVAVPTSDRSPPFRIEGVAAYGQAFTGWSYLANLALRIVPEKREDDTPRFSGHASLGARFDLIKSVDGLFWADGHYLSTQDRFRYAGNIALEVGDAVFGSLALRATPFEDDLGGPLLASFTLGFREPRHE